MSKTTTAIPEPVLERIRGRAVDAYPEECCGFLVGYGSVLTKYSGSRWERHGAGSAAVGDDDTVWVLDDRPAENAAPAEDRKREFLVDPRALLDVTRELRERDEELVGFYHSHPNHPAELSPTDMKFARLWPGTMWLIVPVEAGAAGQEAGRERAWWLPARHDESFDQDANQDPSEPRQPRPYELTIRTVRESGEAAQLAVAAPGRAERARTPRGDEA